MGVETALEKIAMVQNGKKDLRLDGYAFVIVLITGALVSNSWLLWNGENRHPVNKGKGLQKKEQWRKDNEEV